MHLQVYMWSNGEMKKRKKHLNAHIERDTVAETLGLEKRENSKNIPPTTQHSDMDAVSPGE